ncbi:MAG: hypothetical protein MUC48_24640 [Leptolyngbya sp. Prado105]|jgi:hypothetical protein|nr:hypothetical protein [Leptolyngbya sp. Prado105]
MNTKKTLRRRVIQVGIGGSAISSVLFSSFAVASLLPGTPDISGLFRRTQNKPLDSVLNGGNNAPWSEQIPGSSANLPNDLGGLFGKDFPWSEGIPGNAGQSVSNDLLCQLVGDFGSLPISIPGSPLGHCASRQSTIVSQPGDVIVPTEETGTPISTIGTIGPNPFEVRGEQPGPPKSAPIYDSLTLSPIVRQRDLSNLYDQTLSRSTAAPMIGKTGTQWLATSVQSTSQAIERSQKSAQAVHQLAEASKSLSVTQNVMKNAAQMQDLTASMLFDQAVINGKVHASLLGVQQEQAMLLQNQANLSEGIDEMNRRQRSDRIIEAASAARSPLYIPGLYPSETQGGK